jgi:hypothetical protein
MRPSRLDRDLQPPDEIARLDPGCLIPPDPERPQEPEPAQQIHPIRTLRRRRPPARRQLGKERRHRLDGRTLAVHQPIRREQAQLDAAWGRPQPVKPNPMRLSAAEKSEREALR